MERETVRSALRQHWTSILIGIFSYCALGLLLQGLPNPMLPGGMVALNMVIIVIVAYFNGPVAGAIVGFTATFVNFLLKLPLYGSPDWYELGAILPHTIMGAVAGVVARNNGKITTGITIVIGHTLNLLVFLISGLLPLTLILNPIFWNGILAEAAINVIVIALVIGIIQNHIASHRSRPYRMNRQRFRLLSGGIGFLIITLIALYLVEIQLAAFLFILPVILAAVLLGFLEAWLTALLLSGLLSREVVVVGIADAAQNVSLILMLNLVALALGELVENLHKQQRLAQVRLEELTRANRILAQADRLKSDMIQNISHEFRTPLAMILGYSDLLVTGVLGELTEAQTKALEVSQRHGWRLAYLVEQITILHQVEDNNLSWQTVSMSELVQQCVGKWQTRAGQQNCSIDFLENTLPPIEGDAQCLTQAINALLDNAIKFSPDGGPITVRLHTDDGRVVLTVRDYGIGIPPDKHALIFDRFYQADGSTTRRFGGLGTGLAVVKEVVQAHDGDVWVESWEGNGSLFGLWLPVKPPISRIQRTRTTEATLTESWHSSALVKTPAEVGYTQPRMSSHTQ